MNKIKGVFDRRYLPHVDVDGKCQFITFRLYDSVPAEVIQIWKEELARDSKIDDKSTRIILERRIHKYEDMGYGACILRISKVKQLMVDVLNFYNYKKYDLIEYKIMPNHVHVLIQVYIGYSLSSIVHSWKSYSANRIKKFLNIEGKIWMREYYDRFIRNEEHFARTIEYIRNN